MLLYQDQELIEVFPQQIQLWLVIPTTLLGKRETTYKL